MQYDPSRSLSFQTVVREHPDCADGSGNHRAVWEEVLVETNEFMDPELRREVEEEIPNGHPLQILIAYMERHEDSYLSPFEWR